MHGYKQMTGQLASYIAVAIGPIRQKILIAYLIRHFLIKCFHFASYYIIKLLA